MESRWAATSSASRLSGVDSVRRSVSARARRRAGSGCRDTASVRYQSSSWSWRITGRAANICGAVSGSARQSRPAKVCWQSFWPAPKQS